MELESLEGVSESSEYVEEYCHVFCDCCRCLFCTRKFRKKSFCHKVNIVLTFLFYVGAAIYLLYFSISELVEGRKEVEHEAPFVKKDFHEFDGEMPKLGFYFYSGSDELHHVNVFFDEPSGYFEPYDKQFQVKWDPSVQNNVLTGIVVFNLNLNEKRRYDPDVAVEVECAFFYDAIVDLENGYEKNLTYCPPIWTHFFFEYSGKKGWGDLNLDRAADEILYDQKNSNSIFIMDNNANYDIKMTKTIIHSSPDKGFFSSGEPTKKSTKYIFRQVVKSVKEVSGVVPYLAYYNGPIIEAPTGYGDYLFETFWEFGNETWEIPQCYSVKTVQIKFDKDVTIEKEYYDFGIIIWLTKIGGTFAVLRLFWGIFMMIKEPIDWVFTFLCGKVCYGICKFPKKFGKGLKRKMKEKEGKKEIVEEEDDKGEKESLLKKEGSEEAEEEKEEVEVEPYQSVTDGNENTIQ